MRLLPFIARRRASCRVLSPAERVSLWRARRAAFSDPTAESDGHSPDPKPATTSSPRAARGTGNAATPSRYQFDDADCVLPSWHPDHPHYAGP
jgi:hypothetical protein